MIPIDTISCVIKLPLHKYYFRLLFNYLIINFSLHYNSQHNVTLQTYQIIKFIEGESLLLKWN
jgi:hypothetical protein